MEAMRHHPLPFVGLFASLIGFCLPLPGATMPNVVLWDTGSPLAREPQSVEPQWRPVPAEMVSLEKDPLKAASDPGYYGREYAFGGDAVVENDHLTAVFQARSGTVTLFAKEVLSDAEEPRASDGLGRKIAALEVVEPGMKGLAFMDLRVIRNAGDEVALEVASLGETSAVFVFDRTGIVEIRPRSRSKFFRVSADIAHAVVPSFVGDDLIYSAVRSSAASLTLPAENALMGLLEGEDAKLIMTWPESGQQLTLRTAEGAGSQRLFGAIDFDAAGRSFFLSALTAPGIWHAEKLGVAYLEKDVASEWKRPFPAKWQTQLLESKVKTTYAFRDVRGEIWRGVPGSYIYPVWFDGETANFHLSKKIPPKGEALIYFLEGHWTPAVVSTPADIIKATLGRPAAEAILDIEGRKLRTHHRRTDALTHRACTCGYTEVIQALFEKKLETARKNDVAASLDDMVYFVEEHVKRIDEYRRFADELIAILKAQAGENPALKIYLENLSEIVAQIPEEYEVQKENMKSMDYTAQLVEQTMALTGKQDAGNLEAYMGLLDAWRAMGGAQDYVVARYHMIVRQLAQEAGYGCAELPEAIGMTQEILARCKQVLRHADGYEIWSNY